MMNKNQLYYVGDSVTIEFVVSSAPDPQVPIIGMGVSVFNNEGEIIHDDPISMVDNVIKYTISEEQTKHRGNYAALFNFKFNDSTSKTHTVKFTVLPKGVPSEEIKKSEVGKLTPKSKESEIEQAMKTTIRKVRRQPGNYKKKLEEVRDTAQSKTKRREEDWAKEPFVPDWLLKKY